MTPLISTLRDRFEKNMHRHPSLSWANVEVKLESSDKISALEAMESSWGEPDIVGYDSAKDEYIWMDCAKESPTDRRSLCYDRVALDARKENKPKNTVIDMATTLGVSLLTEAEYRYLQSLEGVDLKTSSWIATPGAIRELGWALFCDRRYDTIFTYHNGADSYYAARGWRGKFMI